MLTIRGRTATIAPGIGSIVGGGNTWLLLQTVNDTNVTHWLYYCVAGSTTASTIAITPDGVTTWTQGAWIVDEFTGASASPIASSAQNIDLNSHSSLSIPISPIPAPSFDVAYGSFSQNEDTAITAGAGFADLGATADAAENPNRLKSIWRTGETTIVNVTTATTASDIFGAAAVISLAGGNGVTVINPSGRGNIWYR